MLRYAHLLRFEQPQVLKVGALCGRLGGKNTTFFCLAAASPRTRKTEGGRQVNFLRLSKVEGQKEDSVVAAINSLGENVQLRLIETPSGDFGTILNHPLYLIGHP